MTLEECQLACHNHGSCQYFTWYELENECLLYSDCNFNSTSCADCYTGTVTCSLYDCFEPGVCIKATLLAHDYFLDPEDCLKYCQSNPECKWFSHDPSNNFICALTSNCPDIGSACINNFCIHGQVECESDSSIDFHIMVATGYSSGYSNSVEVIKTETITSCVPLPAKYPIGVDLAMALKHDSKAVICGGVAGSWPTSDCYSYSNDQWSIEAFKLEPARYGAMSVEIRPGEWLVMGGSDTQIILRDTHLLKNGIFTQGPDLPEPNYAGSAVMLNETHLFLIGGQFQTVSPHYSTRNYLLDIKTEQWTQVADKKLESYHHSCGIFYNLTSRETEVANVG